MMIIPILISRTGGRFIFTVKMLTLIGERAGRFIWGKNMLESLLGFQSRISYLRICSKLLYKIGVAYLQ